MGRFTRCLIQNLGALHPRIVCMKFQRFAQSMIIISICVLSKQFFLIFLRKRAKLKRQIDPYTYDFSRPIVLTQNNAYDVTLVRYSALELSSEKIDNH